MCITFAEQVQYVVHYHFFFRPFSISVDVYRVAHVLIKLLFMFIDWLIKFVVSSNIDGEWLVVRLRRHRFHLCVCLIQRLIIGRVTLNRLRYRANAMMVIWMDFYVNAKKCLEQVCPFTFNEMQQYPARKTDYWVLGMRSFAYKLQSKYRTLTVDQRK